jgi:EmrB/QacA subfamily drug resistance transporter
MKVPSGRKKLSNSVFRFHLAADMTTARPAPTREQIERFLPWIVAVALFMQQLDSTIVNTAVPTMAASLKVATLSLKSVVTSYTIGLAVFIPLSGWVAERFGTRRVFGLAVFLFSLGSLLCGLSVNLPMLIASRVLQGAGAAIMLPVGRLALLLAFPKSEMLRVMNFVIIPALLGPLLGPLMGGLIVNWMPWRMIFLLNLPFGALGAYLVHRYMPDYRDAQVGAFDKLGFLLFGSGVALFSYVLEIFGHHSLPTNAIIVLFALSVLLLAGYGWHAQTRTDPLLPLNLFRIRTFCASVVGGFVTRLGISGMPFLLPLLYQVGLGYAPWQAGLLTMPQAAAAIGMKLVTPKILLQFGHRTVLLANTACIGGMIMIFSIVQPGTPSLGHFGDEPAARQLLGAAIHQHELARLRGHDRPPGQRCQHHCQHRAATLDQHRGGGRLAGHRLVSGRHPTVGLNGIRHRAASGVSHARRNHHRQLADFFGAASA